jgi:hypothetical protein
VTLRAVFYEEDDARAVAARLSRGGFEAVVGRERLAGEDDDEDHPWAVSTDAPEFVVDVLVDAHDGWLDVGGDHDDHGNVHGDVPPPPELPTAPRRVKGHFTAD